MRHFNLSNLKPLPNSKDEVKQIGGLFSQKLILTGADATEERIKPPNFMMDFSYFLFATHSKIDESNIRASGLVLTQDSDPREDGFLQIREIFNLNIRAKLVVLSACSTSLGKYVEGEGMIGLTRAWMYAGSSALVTTLWNIEDRSSFLLMSEFFKQIVKGVSHAEALRSAKLWLMEQPDYSYPYFWSGFILTGHG